MNLSCLGWLCVSCSYVRFTSWGLWDDMLCICMYVCFPICPASSSFNLRMISHVVIQCEAQVCVFPSVLSGCFGSTSSNQSAQRCWKSFACPCAHLCTFFFSSQSWGCLKPCGKWSTTTTTSGTTASGETASTASSMSASPTIRTRSCGSTRSCLCDGGTRGVQCVRYKKRKESRCGISECHDKMRTCFVASCC